MALFRITLTLHTPSFLNPTRMLSVTEVVEAETIKEAFNKAGQEAKRAELPAVVSNIERMT